MVIARSSSGDSIEVLQTVISQIEGVLAPYREREVIRTVQSLTGRGGSGMAVVIVLLVLAAQFESITSAVSIMVTVPFGIAAAVLAISFSGGSLNYYSQIGLVLLVGVMAKNGILIVKFANQLRAAGQDIDSAIRDAMRLRIRPVMMTMVSTVLGGLPLVLASNAGAEARAAVGWVIVGGLGFATIFTLMPTPAAYRLIAGFGMAPGAAASALDAELAAARAGSEPL